MDGKQVATYIYVDRASSNTYARIIATRLNSVVLYPPTKRVRSVVFDFSALSARVRDFSRHKATLSSFVFLCNNLAKALALLRRNANSQALFLIMMLRVHFCRHESMTPFAFRFPIHTSSITIIYYQVSSIGITFVRSSSWRVARRLYIRAIVTSTLDRHHRNVSSPSQT